MTGFDCVLSLDRIRDGERIDLVATDAERAAIVEQLGLLSLDALKAHATLSRDGERIDVAGRLQASCAQPCIATGEPVAALVDEAFTLHFLPEPTGTPDEEVELAGADLDTIFHDGGRIALGEALIDTLSLTLDPYPRGPNAEAALKEAGVISEEEAGPFAALAALRDKLGKE